MQGRVIQHHGLAHYLAVVGQDCFQIGGLLAIKGILVAQIEAVAAIADFYQQSGVFQVLSPFYGDFRAAITPGLLGKEFGKLLPV